MVSQLTPEEAQLREKMIDSVGKNPGIKTIKGKKIISIASSQVVESVGDMSQGYVVLFALLDDGTLWQKPGVKPWESIPGPSEEAT